MGGVSAKDAGPRPPCECHDRPMRWHKNGRLLAGGHWRCSVRVAQIERKSRQIYCDANRETIRARSREKRAAIMADPVRAEHYREVARMRHRERYWSDADFRELCVKRASEWVVGKYASDPIWRIERNLNSSARQRAVTLRRRHEELEALRVEDALVSSAPHL